MKSLLTAPLLGLLATSPDTQEAPYCLNHPTWSSKLLVIAEYEPDDPDLPWEVTFGETELEEVRTDSGEVLRAEMFTPEVVGPGDKDPRVDGFTNLGAGESLMVWELARPKQDWKSLQRLAGSYELIRGGSMHWIPVPDGGEPGDDPVAWENEHLAAAGLELKHGVRTIPQLHVKARVAMGVLDEFVLRDDEGEEVYSDSSDGDLETRSEAWDIEEYDLGKLHLIVRFEDGTELTVKDLPSGPEFERIEGPEWEKAKMALEIARVEAPARYCEGRYTKPEDNSPDVLDVHRGFRWVDSKGQPLGLGTLVESGAFFKFTTSCRVPEELPEGAGLEFGVLVGARAERVEFEFTDLPAPK